eukprot:TRINITY_DN2358_c0_g1_i2.p1 TRINITY_DN2358_c0_g1~~TRINITY_DN2358_c0_g1_i2.p1  ORF type:complete len:101 (+),score=3.20 TRINITY_DN2358_c0_g1_i2:82-384(+)
MFSWLLGKRKIDQVAPEPIDSPAPPPPPKKRLYEGKSMQKRALIQYQKLSLLTANIHDICSFREWWRKRGGKGGNERKRKRGIQKMMDCNRGGCQWYNIG